MATRPISRWAVPLLFLVLLAGFAAGIWGNYRDVFPGQGLYRVTGIVDARPTETMLLVRHDAVPGLMDKMDRMVFFVESPEILDRAQLRPGDRVRLTVRQTPGAADRLQIVDVRKIQ